ncbi:MAG: hypothetical protein A2Y62_21850 [Candidatus Fischerbacteria bacterium RBG_13_37_8]|uniref:Probable membrane transporter protein n=1 Tax=Candidatus Fischerbacteria bacterium RBG_13_37_8 TaxID=1817863 RepID=A0A1F5VU42_9BACT|nr:MAG: hypothetical protein A2Y62_21850 [Candidatus Fischerbacteria bacterium RBG_13_37_8]
MIFIVVGFFAGLLGAITGLGGGIIIVPVLTIFFHIPIHKAIGISLVAIVVNSSLASVSYARKGFTDIRLGLTMEQSTIFGAICGAFISGYFNAKILEFIFGIVLLFAAIQMVSSLGNVIAEREIKIRHLSPMYRVKHIPAGMILSFFAGCFAGMLGVGGGIFKIPIMCLLMGVPVKVAVATSSFMILLTGATGAWIFFIRGDVYLELAVLLSVGILAGSLLGSYIGIRMKSKWQSRLFAIVLIAAAIRMLTGIK